MKIEKIGEVKTILSNDSSKHNYFAWPSVARLKNGKIAVVASGFRLNHVCPFGKTVMAISDDEGEGYTAPFPVIDTPLDDRDGGILAFSKSGVIVTSFNNTVDFQRRVANGGSHDFSSAKDDAEKRYRLGYLDMVTKEEENKYLGSTFRVSFDNGETFGKIYRAPVSSPHGPIELNDGTILYVGKLYEIFYADPIERFDSVDAEICAYSINPKTGETALVGEIPPVFVDGVKCFSCEPYAFQTKSGKIICHIRVQPIDKGGAMFTLFQSESLDNGKTWSNPIQIMPIREGAPSHIIQHSSGALIAGYSYRFDPVGIRLAVSYDDGKTWDYGQELFVSEGGADLGYPATVELKDGSLLTVFYAHEKADGPAVIMQQKWKLK